jgi:hypothetical protein
VFAKKISDASSVIRRQLAMGKIFVEPKFSVGIVGQGLL